MRRKTGRQLRKVCACAMMICTRESSFELQYTSGTINIFFFFFLRGCIILYFFSLADGHFAFSTAALCFPQHACIDST